MNTRPKRQRVIDWHAAWYRAAAEAEYAEREFELIGDAEFVLETHRILNATLLGPILSERSEFPRRRKGRL